MTVRLRRKFATPSTRFCCCCCCFSRIAVLNLLAIARPTIKRRSLALIRTAAYHEPRTSTPRSNHRSPVGRFRWAYDILSPLHRVGHILTSPARGLAIHEIFAENARKFPERECVIETRSSQSPARSFSYRQINQSANQLAHHFLSHGCQVGDVVMIYAFRG